MKKTLFANSCWIILACCTFPANGYCFSSAVSYWNIVTGSASNQNITILLEYIEKKYHKDFGDLILAGRGRKVFERRVYGKISFSLNSPTKNSTRIKSLFQREGGSRLQVGLSCDSDDVIFMDQEEKTLGWSRDGKIERVKVDNYEHLPVVYSGLGRIVFRNGEKLYEYGVAKRDWSAVGIMIPELTKKTYSGSEFMGRCIHVFENIGILCLTGENDTIRMFSLATGIESTPLPQPPDLRFVSLIGLNAPWYAVFGQLSGQMQFLGVGNHPNFQVKYPPPLLLSSIGVSLIIPVCSGNPRLLIIETNSPESKKGNIRICTVTTDGQISEMYHPVDFSAPSRAVPECNRLADSGPPQEESVSGNKSEL